MPVSLARRNGAKNFKSANNRQRTAHRVLPKTPTGIKGLDEITGGGLPKGRPTLICGTAGCGKTLLGMEFIVRGATEFNEPGIFVCFEENEKELGQNVASLGFNVQTLIARKKILLDYVRVERSEIEETGEYDLEGLFIRIGHAIDSIGAKRVVLDTIEGLFAALPNEGILRAELRRLFNWLKQKGVTAIITGERGEGTLTRHGLEEYVADCVILLDHRVKDQVSTRRLRVVKYRGSLHGTNEYPFLIARDGISVLPITSLGLTHRATTKRVSTGIQALDNMFEGKGYFLGSSVLISGGAGTGKTSLAAAFAIGACRRGERTLHLAFEESPEQIMRNMRAIGLDFSEYLKQGLIHFNAQRPNLYGLERHLVTIHDLIESYKPKNVIMDPVSNLIASGDETDVGAMLTRLIDYLKLKQITCVFTSLNDALPSQDDSGVGISSLMDTWIVLHNVEQNGERNRTLVVSKSRGMKHSNQVREFTLSNKGIDLIDVSIEAGSVLTGSARLAQKARERADAIAGKQKVARLQREIERKRAAADAQIAALHATLESELEELTESITEEGQRSEAAAGDRASLVRRRMGTQNGPLVSSGRVKEKAGAR